MVATLPALPLSVYIFFSSFESPGKHGEKNTTSRDRVDIDRNLFVSPQNRDLIMLLFCAAVTIRGFVYVAMFLMQVYWENFVELVREWRQGALRR